MNKLGTDMAEKAQRFTDSPIVKWVMSVLQGLAVAAILAVGSSAINKLDSIITSINNFNRDMALVQRDVRVHDQSLALLRTEVDALKQETLTLRIKLEQYEKGSPYARK
jgi:septal ring factor EnvC (AmiA/AmiB activator)